MKTSMLGHCAISCASAAMLLSWSLPADAGAEGIDVARAEAALRLGQAACVRDGGRLWGRSLCGPILVADPATHQAIANRAGQSATLRAQGAIFRGVLPPELNVANTALDWDGVRWTMVAAPLPEDPLTLTRLLMHESWHRVQHELDIPASSPVPSHLAAATARTLMRLEWRALSRALTAQSAAARNHAIADALAFRTERRAAAGAAGAEQERSLELSEGLAEYTGIMLSGGSDERARAAVALAEAERGESFARTFAYASGPAYGLLLDRAEPRWRLRLSRSSDLGMMLARAARVRVTTDVSAARARYGGLELAATERASEARRDRVSGEWVALLVTGPVLRLDFERMQIGFNPNNLVPVQGGTVYPTLRISDVWGILEVTGGAFIDERWSGVSVTAPLSANMRQGRGWVLRLAEGWSIVAGQRAGDFRVIRAAAPPR